MIRAFRKAFPIKPSFSGDGGWASNSGLSYTLQSELFLECRALRPGDRICKWTSRSGELVDGEPILVISRQLAEEAGGVIDLFAERRNVGD